MKCTYGEETLPLNLMEFFRNGIDPLIIPYHRHFSSFLFPFTFLTVLSLYDSSEVLVTARRVYRVYVQRVEGMIMKGEEYIFSIYLV